MVSITPYRIASQADIDSLKENFCKFPETGILILCDISPEVAQSDDLWNSFISDDSPYKINDGFGRTNTTIPISARPQKTEDSEAPKRRRS